VIGLSFSFLCFLLFLFPFPIFSYLPLISRPYTLARGTSFSFPRVSPPCIPRFTASPSDRPFPRSLPHSPPTLRTPPGHYVVTVLSLPFSSKPSCPVPSFFRGRHVQTITPSPGALTSRVPARAGLPATIIFPPYAHLETLFLIRVSFINLLSVPPSFFFESDPLFPF